MGTIILLYQPFSSIQCSARGTSGKNEQDCGKKNYEFNVCVMHALGPSAPAAPPSNNATVSVGFGVVPHQMKTALAN